MEKKPKKKIQGIEKEKGYVIRFLKFKNIKVFKSFAMGCLFLTASVYEGYKEERKQQAKHLTRSLFHHTVIYNKIVKKDAFCSTCTRAD